MKFFLQDKLIRAITNDGKIRAAASISTELVETARAKHNTAPTATAALGRALTAAIFLGLNLKGDDTVTLRIMGDGPLGAIVTQGNSNFEVRGYVQDPNVHLPPTSAGKLDVGKAVGNEGILYVTKTMGLKDSYTGSSSLVSGEIAEDIAYYLYKSEQTPAVVALGVLIDRDHTCIAAGGYFVQALPGANGGDLAAIEENIQGLPAVTDLIRNGCTEKGILEKVFGQTPFQVLGENKCSFSCGCNKERLEKILVSMGEEELKDMIEKDGQAELRCHFCNEYYNFSKEELLQLLNELRQ